MRPGNGGNHNLRPDVRPGNGNRPQPGMRPGNDGNHSPRPNVRSTRPSRPSGSRFGGRR